MFLPFSHHAKAYQLYYPVSVEKMRASYSPTKSENQTSPSSPPSLPPSFSLPPSCAHSRDDLRRCIIFHHKRSQPHLLLSLPQFKRAFPPIFRWKDVERDEFLHLVDGGTDLELISKRGRHDGGEKLEDGSEETGERGEGGRGGRWVPDHLYKNQQARM